MKYVVCRVYRKRRVFLDIPVIFPDILVHDLMFKGAKSALLEHYSEEEGFSVRALSAGSILSNELDAECYGESTTLGVKARPKADTLLIRGADYGACMQF